MFSCRYYIKYLLFSLNIYFNSVQKNFFYNRSNRFAICRSLAISYSVRSSCHAKLNIRKFLRIMLDVTKTRNGEPGTGNGEPGTGNREPGTGNGERGTGVWERVYSGFPHNFQKPRAPGHEFGEKKQLFLTITPVVIKFLSNLIYVSIFNECKKRSEEKGSEKHVSFILFI